MNFEKIVKIAIGVIVGLSIANLMSLPGNTAYTSSITETGNISNNTEFRIEGESVIVYIENGGTVTIVDRLDIARVKLGTLPYRDIEIINNSTISDLEFSESVVREYVFGDIGSLVNAEVVTWSELATPEFSGGDAANPAQYIRHTLNGNSVIVYMEDGGTVTILNKTELLWAVMGNMSIWDVEIINNSSLSDTDFLARLGRGHIFGYGGIAALRRAGLL